MRISLLLISLLVFNVPALGVGNGAWIHVDTHSGTLSVMKGKRVALRFRDVSLGRAGAAAFRVRGDDRTPLGEFRVVKVKPDSRFHRFFQISYPALEHANWARRERIIDAETYFEIFDAWLYGRTPPQDTPLGGYLGIHGVGNGDVTVHRRFNWTNGCIALTNDQVDALSRWVRVGTAVVIE